MSSIKVKGMSCQHCVASVTKALDAIDGISNVKVDLAAGQADYTEEKPVDLATIKQAIKQIGFEVV